MGDAPKLVEQARTIGDQTAAFDEATDKVHR
jgi:hypothetical protein